MVMVRFLAGQLTSSEASAVKNVMLGEVHSGSTTLDLSNFLN